MIVLTSNGGPLIVDIPGGWATVLVALISFVLGPYVLQARANRRIKKIDEKTDRTLDQVENNHRDPVTGEPINMREENDDRHAEVIGLLRDHGELLEEHSKELKKLTKSDAEQNDWIDDFNNTWPRSRFAPPARHRHPDTDHPEAPTRRTP